MRQVWKFPVKQWTINKLDMPSGAEVVHFGPDPEGTMSFWAVVEPDVKPCRRVFYVVGTGRDVEDGSKYIGSVNDAPFVWHLFEKVGVK